MAGHILFCSAVSFSLRRLSFWVLTLPSPGNGRHLCLNLTPTRKPRAQGTLAVLFTSPLAYFWNEIVTDLLYDLGQVPWRALISRTAKEKPGIGFQLQMQYPVMSEPLEKQGTFGFLYESRA